MKERIAGTNIVIEWTLGQLQERLKGDWATFDVIGSDQFDSEYTGEIQTFISNPKIEEVTNIEMID